MGNLLKHAKRELELLGEEPETVRGYLKMIKIFERMGHSGGSASVFIPYLNRLLQFQNLMPLTDDPAEWIHHTEEVWGEPGGVWQNVRNGKAFSTDSGITYTLLDEEPVTDDGDKPVHVSNYSGKNPHSSKELHKSLFNAWFGSRLMEENNE